MALMLACCRLLVNRGRLDWGVKPYANGTNGGIVGTVTYDTTRNELDQRYGAVEAWSPGIPNVTVNLYATVRDENGDFVLEPDGSYKKGPLLNTTQTEAWERPTDCQARDVDGNPVNQSVLPPATGGYPCLEAPMMGLQFQSGFASLDGNYGFTTMTADPVTGDPIEETALPAGDYLVEVQIPNDSFGRPLYQVTREEDINVFGGDQYIPQLPPPLCAGAQHIVDVAGIGADGPNAVVNPSFVDAGGSPYEGMSMPYCDVKLVTLANRRSIAPTFNYFTHVPIPGKFFGYIVDDLNISTNPQDLLFGEKAGVPNSPIGIYDYADNLVTTIQSDPNGIFEVLLPSTNTINCPSPSGVCPNLYRLVGNDPGIPGRLNTNYNPQFRTISAQFEIYPGLVEPADLAPTQIGVSIQAPGSQFNGAVACELPTSDPQLFAVSRPYVNPTGSRNFTITGLGFGTTTGSVKLGNTTLTINSWNDRQISVTVPTMTAGAYQLTITTAGGKKPVNSLTFHVRGSGYSPTVYEVGQGKTYSTIQAALNVAASQTRALVVVYPGTPTPNNPRGNPNGAYYENLIIYSPVKLQGVGPGGLYSDGTFVPGSIVDGLAFGGDTALADAWRAKMDSLTWAGNQSIYEGPVMTVLANTNNFTAGYPATIDGFAIQGGNQEGFPNNINQIGGTPTGLPAQTTTQGGGIYVNGYGRNLRITNNILRSNGGSYGGAIRLGTPDLVGTLNDNQNDNIKILNNRILANGGTNLAGAIGIFAGANGYEVGNNDLCGNFSAEYGGAISHYGFSPNGDIHHNRIYFNRSYDEGGAIMIAGQLPANPATLSPGSGAVNIHHNLIQANLGNDDGGGIRMLMAGDYPINITNNMIVNNISTHEGGGIALDDAPQVRIVNNTIMKNITTSTAATSNGDPAPAGVSTTSNSDQLQATLPAGSPVFSRPVMFNNIFWDNRAGTWTGGGVSGIGLNSRPMARSYALAPQHVVFVPFISR